MGYVPGDGLPTDPTAPPTSGGGVMGWFKALSPAAQQALISGVFSLGGGIASGIGQQGQTEAQIAGNQSIARMNNITSLDNADTNRMVAAGNMMGGSPLAFQRQRAGMAQLGAMFGAQGMGSPQQVFAPPNIAPFQGKVGSGGLGLPPSAASKFFSNDAMANAEVPYWQAVSALNPDINPNLSAAGYGNSPGVSNASSMIDTSRGANANRLGATQNAVWGALGMPSPGQSAPLTAAGQIAPGYNGGSAGNPALSGGYQYDPATGRPVPPDGYEYDSKTGQLKKKGGGFWHKLAKIGLIAGGGIATALTGGAASPWLAAAIGAGTGAASGAMDGGWKGAGLGALTGGLTGGLAPGVGGASSFGQAAEKALLSPALEARMAGAVLPGKAGQVANVASMFMPSSYGGGNQIPLDKIPSMNDSNLIDGSYGDSANGLLRNNFSGGATAALSNGLSGTAAAAPGWKSALLKQLLQGTMGNGVPGQTPPYFPTGPSYPYDPGMSFPRGGQQQQTLQQLLPLLMQLLQSRQQTGYGYPRGY